MRSPHARSVPTCETAGHAGDARAGRPKKAPPRRGSRGGRPVGYDAMDCYTGGTCWSANIPRRNGRGLPRDTTSTRVYRAAVILHAVIAWTRRCLTRRRCLSRSNRLTWRRSSETSAMICSARAENECSVPTRIASALRSFSSPGPPARASLARDSGESKTLTKVGLSDSIP